MVASDTNGIEELIATQKLRQRSTTHCNITHSFTNLHYWWYVEENRINKTEADKKKKIYKQTRNGIQSDTQTAIELCRFKNRKNKELLEMTDSLRKKTNKCEARASWRVCNRLTWRNYAIVDCLLHAIKFRQTFQNQKWLPINKYNTITVAHHAQ